IEGGGRAGMVAPDDTTFAWVEGKEAAPADLDEAIAGWRPLHPEEGASFDKEVVVDAAALSPVVTWGTTPGQVVPVTDAVPDPDGEGDERGRQEMHRAPV